MTSAFRNPRIYKTAIGLTVGGFIGWFAKAEVAKYENNKNSFGRSSDGKQQILASWSNNYRPSVWDDNWDRRDPKSLINPKKLTETKDGNAAENENREENLLKEKKSKAVRHLLLIRHGQYNLNGEDDSKRFLTELGSQQADLTGRRLLELGLPYTVLINSSMTRARETAAIIHKHLEAVPTKECNMLQEGAPFPPEPPTSSWKPDYKFYEDGARIEAAFRKYFHRADPRQTEDSYEIVVCHANVIRYFVCRALQLPPEAWLRMSLRHGSITWISILPSGRVSLRALGDSGYMAPNKITVS